MTEQETINLYATLRDCAEDSKLEIISYTGDSLNLLVTLDVAFDKKHVIRLSQPCFLFMPPHVYLESMDFGGVSLLPDNFLSDHFSCFSWVGSEDELRVVKITTQDDDTFYALYWGQEAFY